MLRCRTSAYGKAVRRSLGSERFVPRVSSFGLGLSSAIVNRVEMGLYSDTLHQDT